MKATITLILSFFKFYAFSCTCVGDTSVVKEFERSHIVITGKILRSETIKIWSDDTVYARSIYVKSHSPLSYDEFKFQSELFGTKFKDYTIQIQTVFKGENLSDTLTIRTGMGKGDCGFQFVEGGIYLIYAVSESSIDYVLPKLGRSAEELFGIYRTDICTRTGLIADRQLDVEEINGF